MSFWSSSLRKGRKEYRCETCNRQIAKGDQHYVEAGVTDGDFNSYRSCIACHELVARLYTGGHIDGEGFLIYELPGIAAEAGEEWPPSALLTPIAEGR